MIRSRAVGRPGRALSRRMRGVARGLAGLLQCSTVEPVHQSSHSHVFVLGDSLVAKCHSEDTSYQAELFAYSALQGCASVARLFGYRDSERLLLLEYLPQAQELVSHDHLERLISALAGVSCFAQRVTSLRTACPALSLGALACGAVGQARSVILLTRDALGAEHVPCGIGDLKLTHFRRRGSDWVFLDLECGGPGALEVMDLARVHRLALRAGLEASIETIARKYSRALAAGGVACEEVALAEAVRLVCLHV